MELAFLKWPEIWVLRWPMIQEYYGKQATSAVFAMERDWTVHRVSDPEAFRRSEKVGGAYAARFG